MGQACFICKGWMFSINDVCWLQFSWVGVRLLFTALQNHVVEYMEVFMLLIFFLPPQMSYFFVCLSVCVCTGACKCLAKGFD